MKVYNKFSEREKTIPQKYQNNLYFMEKTTNERIKMIEKEERRERRKIEKQLLE